MRIRSRMLAAALALLGAGAGAQNDRRSPTQNNSAIRAAEQAAPTEAEKFRAVPGGPATARKDWKKGDPRGKPQDPSQAKRGQRHRRPHKKGGW